MAEPATRRPRILAIANQKGGVGKTTTAVNLGAYLAERGRRVLLVDTDPQANASTGLGVDREEASDSSLYEALLGDRPLPELIRPSHRIRLDVVPSSAPLAGAEVELVPLPEREFRLKAALSQVALYYDDVLIDCPPSLGLLTINALTAATGVLVPVQCEFLALEGLAQLMATIERVRRGLNPGLQVAGLVLTMYDGRANLAQQVAAEVRRYFPRTFQVMIPRSIRLSEAPSHGLTILEYDSRSRGALAYQALADEMIQRLAAETGDRSQGSGVGSQ